ncbi:MAG: N-acetylmuramoyl-L-alanine amidase [Rhodospirillaceae bacterium]|nr:N-acetylmuramoyl-L-alanine amidase [Rhodospirillaceae bacterium]|tara:strand:+ start:69740 stop:70426 length:687 start_codon:yes stop_codon:yes gene_type:complete
MKLLDHPSPNFGDRAPGSEVDKLILHYTGMQSLEISLERMCDSAAEVSAHYLIDEDGTIYKMVDEEKRAWHAGASYWRGETDINGQSIGIELQNPGHEWGYRDFSEAQIASLIELSSEILIRHNIPAKNVLGHSDIAPDRKQDPGVLFPWQQLAIKNIGFWPTQSSGECESDITEKIVRENLTLIGYDPNASLSGTVSAFQRHFRPSLIDGTPDKETASLIAGYAKIP